MRIAGSRGPDHLEPRVAVDRRAVLVLLAGAHPELPDREQDDGLDEHEDRHRGDQQHVVERVDVARLLGGVGREPGNHQRDRDADRGGDHADHQHLRQTGAYATLVSVALGHQSGPASYVFCATNGAGSEAAGESASSGAEGSIMIEAIVAIELWRRHAGARRDDGGGSHRRPRPHAARGRCGDVRAGAWARRSCSIPRRPVPA